MGFFSPLGARFAKKRPSGIASLICRPEGIGLVHVVENQPGKEPRVAVCEFTTTSKAAEKGPVVLEMVKKHGLAKARFIGVLDRSRYTLFPMEKPDMPQAEWRDNLRWKIQDRIDFPANQAVLELFDLPETRKETDKIYVAAARETHVRQCAAPFQTARLELVAIDIPELALRNLAARLPTERQGVGLLHLESSGGLVMVTQNQVLFLARRFDTGLTQLLEPTGGTPPTDPTALALNFSFNDIILEVRRTLDHYEQNFRQSPVNALIIPPLAVPFPGLAPLLSEKLDLPVQPLPLREMMQIPPETSETTLAHCLLAIGAALRAAPRS